MLLRFTVIKRMGITSLEPHVRVNSELPNDEDQTAGTTYKQHVLDSDVQSYAVESLSSAAFERASVPGCFACWVFRSVLEPRGRRCTFG